MEPKEFEELLNDVETRMDRLRALYENWFRGYEKLEPQTARKDVERRIYTMRKELPRNTSLRFRYNTLFQRYTTLTSYWHRTAKQIEEGTYRLQIQRMRRKQARRAEDVGPEREREKRDSALPPPQSYELNLDEQLDVRSLLDDFELDAVARAVEEPGPHSEPPPPPTAPRPMATFAKPVDRARASAPKAAPRAMSESSGYSQPPPSGFDDEPATREGPLPKMPPAAAPRAPMAAAPSGLKGPPAPPPKGASMPKAPPPPPVPGSPATPSGVRAAPAVPSPTGQRAVPRPPPPAVPAPPAPPARPAPSAGIGEQRLKSLYDEYTSARRKNNEGEVRYDALVNSIQKMMPELQKKHAGKRIDFEIVMKDGRVGLKPKAT